MLICNKYKNTPNNFINSLNAKFLKKPKPINKRLCNVNKCKNKPIKAKTELKKIF